MVVGGRRRGASDCCEKPWEPGALDQRIAGTRGHRPRRRGTCDAVIWRGVSVDTEPTFFRALQALLDLRQHRTTVGETAVASQASHPFPSEADCLNYLVDWQLAKYICRACGTRPQRNPSRPEAVWRVRAVGHNPACGSRR